MHRTVVAVALLALVPLAGGFAIRDAPLEASSVRAPCAPTGLHARAADGYVVLAWGACPSEERYQVLRGPSAAELVPLVEVNHASHVDWPAPGTVVYAVRAGEGPLSAAVAVTLG